MIPMKPLADQTVAYTGTSAASAAFSANTLYVRVYSSTDCFITFGATPVSTTSKLPLFAGSAEYFSVAPNDKVAAIQSATAGTLYITEMTR